MVIYQQELKSQLHDKTDLTTGKSYKNFFISFYKSELSQMINIRIMDETIDPAGLHRQVALQVNDIKTMIANVSDNDDQYRQLFIAIRMVPRILIS